MRFLLGMAGLWLATCAAASEGGATVAPAPGCDDSCLTAAARSYWSALLAHDATRLRSVPGLKFTENNVVLRTGQGLWQTVSSADPPDIMFADRATGTVGTSAVIAEGQRPALALARLKVTGGGAISEIETVVARKETSTFLKPSGWYELRSQLLEPVAPGARRPREALIKVAQGYFDRLADASKPMPSLDPRCNRIENGLRSTNNPDPFPGISPSPLSPEVTRLSCAQQFERKTLAFINRIREPRYVMVDESRGIVLSMLLFDHDGVSSASAGGPKLSTPIPSPYSFVVAELFKIEDGKIVLLQALLTQIPYGMSGAW